ncbi:MAG: hypothetical protein R3A10_01600 [Caldilineaceae bacterium]
MTRAQVDDGVAILDQAFTEGCGPGARRRHRPLRRLVSMATTTPLPAQAPAGDTGRADRRTGDPPPGLS